MILAAEGIFGGALEIRAVAHGEDVAEGCFPAESTVAVAGSLDFACSL